MDTYLDIISAIGPANFIDDVGNRARMMKVRGRIPPGDWADVRDKAKARGKIIPEGAFERAEIHYQRSKAEPTLALSGVAGGAA